jgi:hypothetical protein
VYWRTSDAINAEPEAWNELRIVTRGRRCTVYINGQEQASFNGRPPAGGSFAGLFFETGAEAADEGRFQALKISEPGPGDPPPGLAPGVTWADDFATPDTGWGTGSEMVQWSDGKYVITPETGKALIEFYEGETMEGDFEGSVKLHITPAAEGETPLGSLMFWGKGYDDYWALYIVPNGGVGVLHWMNGKWLFPVATKAIPTEANFDPAGMTELRVVTQGRSAQFFVNGVNIGAVTGMPPEGGGYFGMYTESAASGGTAEYDDLTFKQAAPQ